MEGEKMSAEELAREKIKAETEIYKILHNFQSVCAKSNFKFKDLQLTKKDIAGGRMFLTAVRITIE